VQEKSRDTAAGLASIVLADFEPPGEA